MCEYDVLTRLSEEVLVGNDEFERIFKSLIDDKMWHLEQIKCGLMAAGKLRLYEECCLKVLSHYNIEDPRFDNFCSRCGKDFRDLTTDERHGFCIYHREKHSADCRAKENG
jgi:hypothetical protein